MVRVNIAWEILSNLDARRAYDNVRAKRADAAAQAAWSKRAADVRRQAEVYPRKWADFERWMHNVADDVRRAEYGKTEQHGPFAFPTAGATAGRQFYEMSRATWHNNPLCYMTVFGIIGAVVAWVLAELCFVGVTADPKGLDSGIRCVVAMLVVVVTLAVSLAIAEDLMRRDMWAAVECGAIATTLSFFAWVLCVCAVVFIPLGSHPQWSIERDVRDFGIAFGLLWLFVALQPGGSNRIGLACGFVAGCVGGCLGYGVASLSGSLHLAGIVGLVAVGMIAGTVLGVTKQRPRHQYGWLMGIFGVSVVCCMIVVGLTLTENRARLADSISESHH